MLIGGAERGLWGKGDSCFIGIEAFPVTSVRKGSGLLFVFTFQSTHILNGIFQVFRKIFYRIVLILFEKIF